MGGTTDAGLPYPTGQDLMADTDVYIRDLAQAIDYRLGNVSMVVGIAAVVCNSNGDMTVPITAFASLTGAVIQVIAGATVYTTLPLITGFQAQSLTARLWQQQRTTEGYSALPYVGNVNIVYLAWGVPR